MSLISPFKSAQFSHGSEFYEISDQYQQGDAGFSGDYEYAGFTNNVGKWVIQQHQISTGAWRYCNGGGSYPSAWAGKSGLNYVYNYLLFDTAA
jgi:hypothetical protein